MKDKVLITGCFGSVGTAMSEWIEREHPEVEVHGIGRAPRGQLIDGAIRRNVHVEDLRYRTPIEALLKGHRHFDAIFHFASDADVAKSFSRPVDVLDNNILSTATLFEAVRRASSRTMIVLASTSEVYGTCGDGLPVDENAPIKPANPYAVSKAAQDLLAGSYFEAYGTPIIRVRMFTYFNPRRPNLFSSAFARQIAEIEAGHRDVLRHGNLESRRTFIDVRDACSAYWLAYVKGRPGEVYNVGAAKDYSIGKILDAMTAQAKCPIKCKPDPALFRPTDVKAQIPVCDKFRRETGWSEKIPLENSVAVLLSYWRGVVARQRKAS